MNPIILSILNLIRGQTGEVFPLSDFDTSFILDKIVELQNSIGALSSQDGGIASAHVILLAAGVVIFLGVAGEAFFKKTGIPDVAFLMVLGVIIGPVLGIIQPEAGGKMTDMLGNDITYNNKEVYHQNGILVTNGLIHEQIVEEFKKLE